MKTLITIISIILFCTATSSVTAQNGNGSLRDENRRIRQGVASGELTSKETHKLKAQQFQLKKEAYRYKQNDGHIGPRERADLKRDNRQLSRNIYRKKHNNNERH